MLVKMKSLILIGLSKLLSAYYFAIIKRIYFHVRHGKIPKGLNFNSPSIAAKITEYGRSYINTALLWASNKDTVYWMNQFQEKTNV